MIVHKARTAFRCTMRDAMRYTGVPCHRVSWPPFIDAPSTARAAGRHDSVPVSSSPLYALGPPCLVHRSPVVRGVAAVSTGPSFGLTTISPNAYETRHGP